ncbi:MAG: hypothetical protein ACR2HS_06020 [Gammaproteobacteria bacterium]
MLVDHVDMSPGRGGSGGGGGRGGCGGSGGRGGASYSWTEERLTTVRDDSYGLGGYRSYTSYTYHSQPGGSNGSSGSSGRSGCDGHAGKNGLAGKYCIILNKMNTSYVDRYNLIISNFKHITSDDGIIEPGEMIALSNLTVLNNGFMPTPKIQPIQISIQSTNWIQPGDPIQLPGWLPANQKYTSDQTLYFTIKQNLSFIPNKVPKAQVTLGWHALVARVNKYFESVETQKKNFEVRYPVEISLICNAHAITRSEEAPFVIQVRNVSTVTVGTNATNLPRKLQLELTSSSGKGLMWNAKDNIFSQNLNNPIIFDIPLLAANSGHFISGTLKYTDPNVTFYTNIPLQANLKLGPRNNTKLSSAIQRSESTLQLAENYVFDPNSEFVLIINSNTTRTEIEQWHNIAALLGSIITIWNVSIYSGFDYRYKRKDGGCFIEQLKNKVVIILNNEYIDDFTNSNKTIFSDDLCLAEIYDAAKEAMISTYVVGSNLNLYNQHILQIATQSKNRINGSLFSIGSPVSSQVATKKYFRCGCSSYESDLEKFAKKLYKKLNSNSPCEQHVVAYNSQVKLLQENSNLFFAEYELGKIWVWNGINNLEAKVAFCTERPDSVLQSNSKIKHAFTLLKLLSFEKKLIFLSKKYNDPEKYKLIISAILSDLADEQYVWRQHKWSGNFPKEKLKISLSILNFLESFNFRDMPPEKLTIMLIKYYSFVTFLPTILDYCWFYRRGRILTTICQETVKDMIRHLYPIETSYNALFQRLSDDVKMFKKEFKNNSKNEVLAYIRNPFNDLKFNNFKQVSTTLNYSHIPAINIPNRNIVENRYVFFAATARNEAISKFETLARSDYNQAQLYLPKQDNSFDNPDNISKSLKFLGTPA